MQSLTTRSGLAVVGLGVSALAWLPACAMEEASSEAPPAEDGDTSALQVGQVPLPGSAIPQFVQPLPRLSVQAGGTVSTVLGNQPLTIRMCEFWANVLPPGTFAAGVQPKTRVWGYIAGDKCPANGPTDHARDTYVGPGIVNTRGSSTNVRARRSPASCSSGWARRRASRTRVMPPHSARRCAPARG